MSVYVGAPPQILHDLAEKLLRLLESAGVPPDGLHLLALLYLACNAMGAKRRMGETDIPEFRLVLSLVTRLYTHSTEITPEEIQLVNEGLTKLLIQCGGRLTTREEPLPVVLPPNGMVH